MFVTATDKACLRELAKRYSDIAQSDIQAERFKRMRNTNDLKVVRPPVLIDEIPWHEMDIDGELHIQTKSPFAQKMEQHFRRALFVWKHFQCDTLFENLYPITKTYTSTGTGFEPRETTLVTDPQNSILSHAYHDQLADDTALENLQSQITVNPEKDIENLAIAGDILDGILPVELRGIEIYYAPWDVIPRLHGVNNTLFDMVDRPDFMHRMIAKFTENWKNMLEKYEALGLLDPRLPALHCTPSRISGSPADDYSGGNYRMKDMWFRSMAQLFGAVSPEMHWEFDLHYSLPLMEKCAYTYYGCCEALDSKIDMLKKIPNLRKIGVTPWADINKCAEQIGGGYVLARKPNPANVAIHTSPDVIRHEIIQTVEAALRYGCPCEFVLKDISTVNFNPYNLIVWAKTVSEVLDRYYS